MIAAPSPDCQPLYGLELDAAALIAALPKTRDPGCNACWACVPDYRYMRLCATCGCKRCPHANDHRNECTGSNDTGQAGSAYEFGSGAATSRRFAAIFGPDHPLTRIFTDPPTDGEAS